MEHKTSASGAENGELLSSPGETTSSAPLVFAHQRQAFDQLVELTQIALYTQSQCFPIRPRTNSLVVGPTGSGKTYLASAVAKALSIPILLISISEWVLIACSTRGAGITWPAIVEFLSKNKTADGVIIAIDEIDKLNRDRTSSSSYEVFLLTEAFSLFDRRIPNNLRDQDENELIGSSTMESAREVLASRTMLIGMGAFQDVWEAQQAASIGFGRDSSSPEMPSLKKLAESIPPELANRFRSEVLILPPLKESDYQTMLAQCAEKIPGNFRERFLAMGKQAIPLAVHNRKGPRFLEELLVDLLIAERREVRMLLGHSKSPKECPEELSVN